MRGLKPQQWAVREHTTAAEGTERVRDKMFEPKRVGTKGAAAGGDIPRHQAFGKGHRMGQRVGF